MSKNLLIRIKGSIPEVWSDWFDDLEVKSDGEYTILTGEVPDHPAVHGIIERIRDLNLDLVSVNLTDD
jgi:hypothetical protein